MSEVQKVAGYKGGRTAVGFPICGKVTLDVDGGVKSVAADVTTNDIVLVSLESDDTGTPITSLIAKANNGSITFTRTDDASSADDAVIGYVVIRPE